MKKYSVSILKRRQQKRMNEIKSLLLTKSLINYQE